MKLKVLPRDLTVCKLQVPEGTDLDAGFFLSRQNGRGDLAGLPDGPGAGGYHCPGRRPARSPD